MAGAAVVMEGRKDGALIVVLIVLRVAERKRSADGTLGMVGVEELRAVCGILRIRAKNCSVLGLALDKTCRARWLLVLSATALHGSTVRLGHAQQHRANHIDHHYHGHPSEAQHGTMRLIFIYMKDMYCKASFPASKTETVPSASQLIHMRHRTLHLSASISAADPTRP
jgi:hypothetical protein